MQTVNGRKNATAKPSDREEDLRNALKGLRQILNVIELDERLAYSELGRVNIHSFAQQMINERSRRYQYFNGHLFADPAWDIMLELFVAELESREVPVTNLCFTSNVPDTTVLRWIKTLSLEGLVDRRKDKVDKRRVLVQLTRPAADGMRKYIEEQIGGRERLATSPYGNEASAKHSDRSTDGVD